MPNSIGQIQQRTNPSPRDLASLILIFLFSQKLKRKSESLENMHFLSANNKISPYVQIKCDLLNLSKIVCLMSENLHCLFKRNWLWIVPWITCWALPYLTAEQSLAWNGLLARVPDRSIFPYHGDICVGFLPYFKIVPFFFSFFIFSICYSLFTPSLSMCRFSVKLCTQGTLQSFGGGALLLSVACYEWNLWKPTSLPT